MEDWNFACPDWRERLKAGASLVPTLPLDRDEASRSVRIFNKLRLPDVSGQPAMRDAAGDWQRDLVAALFGSMMPDGRRRVRKIFELVPKKNSKTTKAGAIGVTALLMDDEPRQPYYLLGPTQEIAQRGFDQASGMIMADPVLRKRFHIRAHLKTIVDQVTDSFLKVQTFDEKVATGGIPKGAIVDELHILGKVHYASRVLGQIWGGMVSRPGAFLLMITTQSDEPPAGVFKEELALARAVRDGRVTGEAATVLPILYEFPEEFQTDPDQPWRNPEVWPMVLPNLGRSVQLDLLRPQFFEAVEKGEAELRRWASQHLNIEIGLGLHANRWRGADYWEAAAEPGGLTLEALLERCEVVVCAADGGGSDDLFGFSVIGRERDTGVWLAWCHAWALRKVFDIRKDIAPRLTDFENDGDLTVCDSGQEMVEDIAAKVELVKDSGLIPERDWIGTDPADIGALLDALNAIGIADDEIFPVAQGVRLNSAIGTAEFKLHDCMLRHDGSALMAWCVGNAKAVLKGNSLAIDKEISGSGKIDPLIAMLSAIKLMERNPASASTVSAYETRELLVI